MNKFEYKLVFESEQQANDILSAATEGLKSWQYDIHVIGKHTKRSGWDEETETYTIEDELAGWHVDVLSRVELVIDATFKVEPNNPIHEFMR